MNELETGKDNVESRKKKETITVSYIRYHIHRTRDYEKAFRV